MEFIKKRLLFTILKIIKALIIYIESPDRPNQRLSFRQFVNFQQTWLGGAKYWLNNRCWRLDGPAMLEPPIQTHTPPRSIQSF